jgi:DnaJ-domain-containing protein 1
VSAGDLAVPSPSKTPAVVVAAGVRLGAARRPAREVDRAPRAAYPTAAMTQADNSAGLDPDVVDVFARGLYHLANVDGMDDRERKLLGDFLAEAGSSTRVEDLADTSFSATEAAMVLETTFLRRVFVKAAVAMVKADGVFSDAERHAIGEIADAFGFSNAEFGDIEQEATRVDLEKA